MRYSQDQSKFSLNLQWNIQFRESQANFKILKTISVDQLNMINTLKLNSLQYITWWLSHFSEPLQIILVQFSVNIIIYQL